MSNRHFLHVMPSFCAAGAQVRTTTLMRGLGESIRHTVVAIDGRTEAAELAANATLLLERYVAGSGPLAGITFFRKLLQQNRPDLLLTYNWGAIDAAIAARSLGFSKVVHHEDGFNADEAFRLKLRRNWARTLLLSKTEVVVPSRNLQNIARTAWRLPRVHFVPNGIEAATFTRDATLASQFRASFGIAEDTVVIGTVGHLRPVKNFARLIRAVSQLNHLPIKLVIVGDGDQRSTLTAAAASAGITVIFAGHQSAPLAAYSAFDIFALSSDSEQQPISLLEAMAAGLPVCATDVGDIRATLPAAAHVNLVPSDEQAGTKLAAAIGRLAADADQRQALGQLNLSHVKQHYSDTVMVQAYRDIYAGAAGLTTL